MDPFFTYVSITALVILILILILVGVSLTNLQSMDSYPPTQNTCPDYWDVSSNPAYCGIPVNANMKNGGNISTIENTGKGFKVNDASSQNIGLCKNSTGFGCKTGNSDPYLELKDAPASLNNNYQYAKLNNNTNWSLLYPGISERCAQKSWANTMNITWDGVTNYNGC
jgi:hypothetical protein